MSDLFQAAAGTIVKSGMSSPSFLSVDGLDPIIGGGRLMLTSIHINRGQDFQIVKTLSNAFYIYAFGESPGRILVGGLLFLTDCVSGSVAGEAIQEINSYYENNNIYFKENPVRIASGGSSWSTYLTELSVVLEQNQFNYGSFSLGFTMVPPQS